MTPEFNPQIGDIVISNFGKERYEVLSVYKDRLWLLSPRGNVVTSKRTGFSPDPIRHKRWICIPTAKYGYSSREEARKYGTTDYSMIACIPIEFEEGEGL